MFTVDYQTSVSTSTEIKYSGTLAVFGEGGENYGALADIDFGSNVQTAIDYVPESDFPLPEGWGGISAIAAGGKIFTPAQNVESPQPGEYLYNPYTQSIKVYGTTQSSLVLYGELESILISPAPVLEPFPGAFTSIPLKGSFTISRAFEQHPSASFNFETYLSKSTIQDIFTPGLEIDFYGIPFRISSLNIDEMPRSNYPGGRQKVSINFGSRWENYLSEPVFLRKDGSNNITSNNYDDPECAIGYQSQNQKDPTITIQALLNKLGIAYIGPSLAPIPVPRGTPRDAVISFGSLLEPRLRIANSFVRWSNVKGIEVVAINALNSWNYSENKICGPVKTVYDSISKSSKRKFAIPDLNPQPFNLETFPSTVQPLNPILTAEKPTNLGFEYSNAELSADFEINAIRNRERTQGYSKPRYVKKETKLLTTPDGDELAHQPLPGVESIQGMSLCSDNGGDTRGRSYTTTENGTIIRVLDELFGFVFTAKDIFNLSRKRLDGDPSNYWQCVKRTTTEYIYDYVTGYLLYVIQTGFSKVRYKQESAEKPETLVLPNNHPERDLYNFFDLPILAQTSYVLQIMPEYSKDGAYQLVKICNRDGTSRMAPLYNPDYAPPYYVLQEIQESTSFASRANPKSTTRQPLPDIFIGESSGFESYVQVTPAEYEETIVGFEDGFPLVRKGKVVTPQRFRKYIKKFKAQGDNIGKSLEDISTEYGEGNPPVHQRRNNNYELEEKSSNQTSSGSKPKYRYLLQSPGYSASDPINGSESFPLSKTLNEALVGANCKLAIENSRNGIKETLDIPLNLAIAEGDKFDYYCSGQFRQRLVLNVNHTFNILGEIDGIPKVTASTSLTLGRWIQPQVTYNQTLIPTGSQIGSGVLNAVSESLGKSLDWSQVKSRRNP